MAQTDARAGFRLPWSSDRQSTESTEPDTETETATETADAAEATGWPTDEAASPSHDQSGTIDPWTGAPVGGVTAPESPEAPSAPAAPAASTTPAPTKKPSKFLADLTKAMQAAAEDARGRALTQLQSDAKTYVEAIHGRSSTEAASLRRNADDDVAAVREWSKAEIARVREETESRITDRKARLEAEIEEHAAVIEREIDAVQKTVSSFEDEMAAFFERLLAEEDPTRFATMAENLPEPPSFEGLVAAPVADEPAVEPAAVLETVDAPAEDLPETITDEPTSDAEAVVEAEAEPAEAEAVTEPEAETAEDPAAEALTRTQVEGEPATMGSVEGFEGDGEFDGEVDREAAFAAIQAAAEAAASAEVAADAAARAEAVADVAIEIIGNHEEDGEADPRYAALGLSPDLEAAEAEAFAAAGSSDEDIPEVGDDALAARLAGLGSSSTKSKGNAEGATSTQVVVVGLVSVASIASFKRHLGRLTGVNSVGVSSGPDGEFVFAVNHGGDVVLRDLIPSLPSFQARVTSSGDGAVHVTAHDPEADA
ncbi:MAG TPA: hypothetical protein VFI34_10280 [Candidatus Limnocylindrales bacterium]|nr:hypothetical protein [Candidatus Limnocylindrales bacterium]